MSIASPSGELKVCPLPIDLYVRVFCPPGDPCHYAQIEFVRLKLKGQPMPYVL